MIGCPFERPYTVDKISKLRKIFARSEKNCRVDACSSIVSGPMLRKLKFRFMCAAPHGSGQE
jgi:hypothetical protein